MYFNDALLSMKYEYKWLALSGLLLHILLAVSLDLMNATVSHLKSKYGCRWWWTCYDMKLMRLMITSPEASACFRSKVTSVDSVAACNRLYLLRARAAWWWYINYICILRTFRNPFLIITAEADKTISAPGPCRSSSGAFDGVTQSSPAAHTVCLHLITV